MTVKPDARLRDWHLDADGRLQGRVYGHRRFDDGSRIMTSRAVRQFRLGDRLLAKTGNTLYELAGLDGKDRFAGREARRKVPAPAPKRRGRGEP